MALPANWRIAESIRTLQAQLRPLAPSAPAVAFGTVADSAHSTSSDHYPRVFAGLGSQPVVTAGDFPKAGDLDPRAVLDSIRRSRDPRVKYGISQGQMFSSYATSAHPAWTWRPYSGSDGHWDHGHLSVVGDARADQPHPWAIGSTPTGGDDMSWDDVTAILGGATEAGYVAATAPSNVRQWAKYNMREVEERLGQKIAALTAKVDAVAAAKPAAPSIDAAALGAALASDTAFVAAIAAAVASGLQNSAGATAAQVEQIVDKQLDQAFGRAVDAD